MKNHYMKFRTPLLLILVTIVLIAGCSGDVTYKEALEENREKIEDPKTLEDANFLVEAKSLNILATKLSALASDSGYSSALVSFARSHAEQHKEMEEDLQDLAKEKDITMPAEMTEEHKALYYQLSSANRQEFDRNYIKIIKKINEENKSLYTRNATGANDPDIRAYAARKLDPLQANLESISKIEEQLLQTYDDNRSQP
jgi:putative membrane protein